MLHRSKLVIYPMCVAALALALFAVRMAAPPDIMDRDQERPASYVLDVVQNGRWLIQQDWMNDITSKPPLYTWLAALFALTLGGVSTLSMYLPCILATLACACIVYCVLRKMSGPEAGLIGATLYLCNYLVIRQMALARTDALFSLAVSVAALLAFRAWSTGRGWTVFWLAVSLATLTKGPLALLLAMGGLAGAATVPLANHSPRNWKQLVRRNAPGLALFFAIAGGWLALSIAFYGEPVYTKLITKELLHPTYDESAPDPLYIRFWKPTSYFIGRFLPASLFTLAALWRLFRNPATSPDTRRFERFLSAWFLTGLLVLSLSTHQRGDLLMPILAPAAILAGREALRILRLTSPRRAVAFAVVLAALGLLLFDWHYYHIKRARYEVVRHTVLVRDWAQSLKPLIANQPVLFADSPFALQFYLGRRAVQFPLKDAAARLATETNSLVVVRDRAAMESALSQIQPALQLTELSRIPTNGTPYLYLLAATAQ